MKTGARDPDPAGGSEREHGGTLCETLALLEPWLVGALVHTEAWERLLDLGERLPAVLGGLIGFEIRLAGDALQTDLLVCARTGPARAALARGACVPAEGPASAAWERIGSFCRSWEHGAPPYGEVQTLWLELDVPGASGGVPVPSVFIGALPLSDELAAPERWRPRYLQLARAALEQLSGRGLAPPVVAALETCVRLLPEHGAIFQTGTMLSRPDTPVRIEIRGLAPAELAGYLERVGCRADLGEIERLARGLARACGLVDLALDVREAVDPRIGLVCPFDPHRSARVNTRPAELLDHLVSEGLCTDEKRRAFLAFAGTSASAESSRWPGRLRDSSALLAGRFRSLSVRQLGQIKVVVEPGAAPTAKGYLGAEEAWAPVPAPRGTLF